MRILAPLALLLAAASAAAQPGPPTAAVGAGSIVRLEYTMTDDAGQVLDSNVGSEPLVFTQGRQELVPGLERALAGMHAGEEKQVSVAPEEGYGPVDPDAEAEVPVDLIPADARAVGSQLVARGPSGDTRLVRVKEVRERTIVLDLNHPFAGMTLHFAVRVLGVEPPPAR